MIVDYSDLTMERRAVLVPVPIPGLPFVLHLLDCLAGKVTLLAGCVNSDKLTLAGKESLSTTMVSGTFPGDKMAHTGRVLERYTGKLKNNLVVLSKRISPSLGVAAILVTGQLGFASVVDWYVHLVWDYPCPLATIGVSLVELKEIGEDVVHVLVPILWH
jgi:hypothetical protein